MRRVSPLKKSRSLIEAPTKKVWRATPAEGVQVVKRQASSVRRQPLAEPTP
jgi:hypothetical protein